MIKQLCWLAGVVCLLAFAGPCPAATPEENFESLYGQEVKTLAPKDMPAFAGKLIADAEKLKDDRPLADYLVDKACEFITKSPAGSDKTKTGQQLLGVLMANGDSCLAAGKAPDAIRWYDRAVLVATAIHSDRLGDIQAKVKEVAGKGALIQKMYDLEARLVDHPDDADAAKTLVMLCVVELDRLPEAARYVAATKDSALQRNVNLAGGAASQPEDSKRLGDWYRGLAGGANVTPSAATTMLTRAKACYEKFLAQYSRQDAESLAARKAVEDIAKELDKPAAPAAQPAAATVWTTITNCIANKLVADSDAAGRDFGEPYRDQSPQGYLIGFRLTLKPFIKNKYVASVQPIFMTRGSVEQVGAVHGKPTGDLVVIKAKLGYAVSALTTQSGLNMDFFQPTFAKIKGATLDPSDTYAGDAIGAARGGKKDAGSSGNLIIGIFGKADDRIESIGLTFLTPK